jgi:hypothetical protein
MTTIKRVNITKVKRSQILPCFVSAKNRYEQPSKEDDDGAEVAEDLDTIRVRIWRALSSSYGQELSMRQLGSIVGERRIGDLNSHLVHVEKQAKTVNNKSSEWKRRRGIDERTRKVKLTKRREKNGMIYIKLF